MKIKLATSLISLGILILFSTKAWAQADSVQQDVPKWFLIVTFDGGEFLGTILSEDAKEVLIVTKEGEQISIPKYQIKQKKEVSSNELSLKGEYLPEPLFATRYFITTNGLPMKKGSRYILWNWYGPDFQFGVSDHVGVGIMTSWLGIPIIGTVKYSHQFSEKTSIAVGTLAGIGSWAAPDFGILLPYGSFTFGDARNNITLSGGYGSIWTEGNVEGNALVSIAGTTALGSKVSFVFDSFLVPFVGTENSTVGLLIPGIRIQHSENKAFQFGFAGLLNEDGLATLPLPMIQWFRKF
ncbi:MAG: hypothetical protein JEZ03_07180 [Bacteroidales bacterium]|nr:hypothetical protein [Bacteroidales bacterium]